MQKLFAAFRLLRGDDRRGSVTAAAVLLKKFVNLAVKLRCV